MKGPKPADLVGNLLILIEFTPLGDRVAAGGLERWLLDCARRALGTDLGELDDSRPHLRAGLDAARAWLRDRGSELGRRSVERAVLEATRLEDELERRAQSTGESHVRACAVVESVVATLETLVGGGGGEDEGGAEGMGGYETAARAAQRAFRAEDQRDEDAAQARRLLLRCRLIPSGADLLVRLDYAEASGLLPDDPAERRWLDHHRQLLAREDEEGRIAVVIRHLESVFGSELDAAK